MPSRKADPQKSPTTSGARSTDQLKTIIARQEKVFSKDIEEGLASTSADTAATAPTPLTQQGSDETTVSEDSHPASQTSSEGGGSAPTPLTQQGSDETTVSEGGHPASQASSEGDGSTPIKEQFNTTEECDAAMAKHKEDISKYRDAGVTKDLNKLNAEHEEKEQTGLSSPAKSTSTTATSCCSKDVGYKFRTIDIITYFIIPSIFCGITGALLFMLSALELIAGISKRIAYAKGSAKNKEAAKTQIRSSIHSLSANLVPFIEMIVFITVLALNKTGKINLCKGNNLMAFLCCFAMMFVICVSLKVVYALGGRKRPCGIKFLELPIFGKDANGITFTDVDQKKDSCGTKNTNNKVTFTGALEEIISVPASIIRGIILLILSIINLITAALQFSVIPIYMIYQKVRKGADGERSKPLDKNELLALSKESIAKSIALSYASFRYFGKAFLAVPMLFISPIMHYKGLNNPMKKLDEKAEITFQKLGYVHELPRGIKAAHSPPPFTEAAAAAAAQANIDSNIGKVYEAFTKRLNDYYAQQMSNGHKYSLETPLKETLSSPIEKTFAIINPIELSKYYLIMRQFINELADQFKKFYNDKHTSPTSPKHKSILVESCKYVDTIRDEMCTLLQELLIKFQVELNMHEGNSNQDDLYRYFFNALNPYRHEYTGRDDPASIESYFNIKKDIAVQNTHQVIRKIEYEEELEQLKTEIHQHIEKAKDTLISQHADMLESIGQDQVSQGQATIRKNATKLTGSINAVIEKHKEFLGSVSNHSDNPETLPEGERTFRNVNYMQKIHDLIRMNIRCYWIDEIAEKDIKQLIIMRCIKKIVNEQITTTEELKTFSTAINSTVMEHRKEAMIEHLKKEIDHITGSADTNMSPEETTKITYKRILWIEKAFRCISDEINEVITARQQVLQQQEKGDNPEKPNTDLGGAGIEENSSQQKKRQTLSLSEGTVIKIKEILQAAYTYKTENSDISKYYGTAIVNPETLSYSQTTWVLHYLHDDISKTHTLDELDELRHTCYNEIESSRQDTNTLLAGVKKDGLKSEGKHCFLSEREYSWITRYVDIQRDWLYTNVDRQITERKKEIELMDKEADSPNCGNQR